MNARWRWSQPQTSGSDTATAFTLDCMPFHAGPARRTGMMVEEPFLQVTAVKQRVVVEGPLVIVLELWNVSFLRELSW